MKSPAFKEGSSRLKEVRLQFVDSNLLGGEEEELLECKGC